ncbi:hypothetical protein BDV95DRAFT_612672 [Massariosphaeria phaeospora]|uniref:F-box domain-containing protein n=1 Tax=Massariosphaeria phaeospora TaxID=100035 RepID=A0A7C8HYX3_9PLEO|nr:hypothetical protein BDV95DRAFT_612672 [Massariosphaeria phaeospora]
MDQVPDVNYSPLLDLPAELRLQIYSFIAPGILLATPPSNYVGLFLSCKQIHQELEHWAIKGIQRFLKAMNENQPCVIKVETETEIHGALASVRDVVLEAPWADAPEGEPNVVEELAKFNEPPYCVGADFTIDKGRESSARKIPPFVLVLLHLQFRRLVITLDTDLDSSIQRRTVT